MKKKTSGLPKRYLAILFLIVAFQLITGFVFAQNGTIRGAVFDEKTGEPQYAKIATQANLKKWCILRPLSRIRI